MAERIRKWKINHYRACRCDLQNLANWCIQAREALPVKAFYGVTMVWWAAARLGFEVHDRRRVIRNQFDGIFDGNTLSGHPREVWLSRVELIRRYAERPLEMQPLESA